MAKFYSLFAAIIMTVYSCFAAEKTVPRVIITLPPEVPSESVRINYFIGGYGDFVRQQRNVSFYTITTVGQNRVAGNIKIIMYAPGCAISTFDLDFNDSSIVEQRFVCQPLSTILLTGEIVNKELIPKKPLQLAIDYVAAWDHKFFGIQDGFVTTIPMATTTLDASGTFSVKLPDLGNDLIAAYREGWLSLALRERDTGNILGWLQPIDKQPNCVELCIQSPYPEKVAFNVSLSKN